MDFNFSNNTLTRVSSHCQNLRLTKDEIFDYLEEKLRQDSAYDVSDAIARIWQLVPVEAIYIIFKQESTKLIFTFLLSGTVHEVTLKFESVPVHGGTSNPLYELTSQEYRISALPKKFEIIESTKLSNHSLLIEIKKEILIITLPLGKPLDQTEQDIMNFIVSTYPQKNN